MGCLKFVPSTTVVGKAPVVGVGSLSSYLCCLNLPATCPPCCCMPHFWVPLCQFLHHRVPPTKSFTTMDPTPPYTSVLFSLLMSHALPSGFLLPLLTADTSYLIFDSQTSVGRPVQHKPWVHC